MAPPKDARPENSPPPDLPLEEMTSVVKVSSTVPAGLLVRKPPDVPLLLAAELAAVRDVYWSHDEL